MPHYSRQAMAGGTLTMFEHRQYEIELVPLIEEWFSEQPNLIQKHFDFKKGSELGTLPCIQFNNEDDKVWPWRRSAMVMHGLDNIALYKSFLCTELQNGHYLRSYKHDQIHRLDINDPMLFPKLYDFLYGIAIRLELGQEPFSA